MYVIAAVVAVLFLVLLILARNEQLDFWDKTGSRLLYPIYRMGAYIYRMPFGRASPSNIERQVRSDLERLHPGEKAEKLITAYYVNKIVKMVCFCAVGTFLALVLTLQAKERRSLNDGSVARGSYDEEAKEVEVECLLPDGMQEFTIEVGARVFDEEKIEELYTDFCDKLPQLILGENVSLQEVSFDLHLANGYEGYPFEISWESANPDVVQSDGRVENIETACQVELRATISYGQWERTESLQVVSAPIMRSQEEKLYSELMELLVSSEMQSRTEEKWQLPTDWNGTRLVWTQKTEDWGFPVWIGAILLSILIYILTDKDLHEDAEKTKRQMKKEYPNVVYKLVLYLGAGMTIRNTFQKMAEEYERTKEEKTAANLICEEIVLTCRELQAGVSESVAYEHFGKRTGVQEYIRLAALLTQNLKKGNRSLFERLREEVAKVTQDRLQYAKRLGEEAVTKLLLPMVMMLLVVMLIIMIPAFSSVGT